MAFRAAHAEWGTVFAHLPDLGCGRSWEAVWKAKPAAPIVCDECRHAMYAKASRTGLRFFAHAPGAPTCALGVESVAHHLLKLELAGAARDAGAHAELEVPGPGGTWRADVLATDPTGSWKTALEAQLAPITATEITARTARMRADNVSSIWFSDRPRPPWLGAVPSVRLATNDTGQGPVVAEGLVKFDGRHWTAAPQVAVADFLRWVFTGKVIPHTPRASLAYPLRALPQVFTAPQYIKSEEAHLVEEERLRSLRENRMTAVKAAQERKRDEIRARNAVSRTKARSEAAGAEQAARAAQSGRMREVAIRFRLGIDLAIAKLASEHDVVAAVGWSTGDPRYAGGVPLVDVDGVPVAVFDPDPGRVRGDAFRLVVGLLLIFPSQTSQQRFEKAMKRTKYKPVDGYRIDFVDGSPSSGRSSPASGQPCSCTSPQLVAAIQNAEYPAEPSEQMGPAAALFRAKCRLCGGKYERPWRRTSSAPIDRTSRTER
ncbi:competence protein CoiA [Streptomyces sp. NPDC058287]|uniref:competence protein CoiA family protein n=1 Tax=unclassified Streptomyces TaxID=2593676 RepID=UPI0036E33364